jgi:subtilisin family serine protease
MKYIYSALFGLLCICNASAQTVFENYKDGQLYLKLDKVQLSAALKENPRQLPLASVPLLKDFVSKYGITKLSRPFAQADDDRTLPYVLRVEFSKSGLITQFLRDLDALKAVDYAEKIPLTKIDIAPNEGTPTWLTQINAPNAWTIFNGNSNITVAIVDNAIMWNHVDLVQNTYTNTGEVAGNSIDDDGNGYVDDVNGWDAADWDNNTVPTNLGMSHGTHCAGIAAGRTDNNIGIASIGWNVKMIPVKCQVDGGSTTAISNGYDGIIYAAKAKARVISCSWGGSGFATTEQTVINYAWNKGCIIMASAGNSSNNTQNYPGAYANVFCVAAVDPTNVKSSYSNFGTWVDISAPGDNINSTYPYTPTNTPAYNSISGTSMATPMVAGLAALMLSKSPYMTQQNVLNCISTTAANIYTLVGNASYTTSNQLGAGRIEAFAAMTCASTFSALPPVANFMAFPRNSCPSTPIQFNDSSFYAPTAWSWTFQAGTPATATGSNPTVSWASAGTYSVAMTCSNANGSNSITKLSYITIAGPIALPFSEGFQASTFLPSNWTPKNIDNDAIFWARTTTAGGFGTSTACAIFDNFTYNAAYERDEMRSPKYSFSTVASARLRFDVAYARYDATFSDSLEVRLTTDCGTTWNSIYLKGGTQLATAPDASTLFVPTSLQWRRDTIDISALTAGQGNVMFAFVNRGHYGQPIYLDNINLVFPTPTLNVATATVCANTSYSFNNTSIGVGTYTWTLPGASPASATVANPSASYATPGNYTINVIGRNGTSTTTVTRSITVIAYPTITVSPTSVTICSGATTTLTGSGASTYNWATAAGTVGTAATLTTNPGTTTIYTLTGFNNICGTSAAITVSVKPTPTLAISSMSICSGTSTVLTVSGATTYSWSSGGTATAVTVSPNLTTVYTVTGTTNGCVKSNSLSVTVVSSVQLTVLVNSVTICSGSLATLQGSGGVTYNWFDGTSTVGTSSILSVSPPNTTNYTLTGINSICSSTAALTISVNPTPTLTVNSYSICFGTSANMTVTGAATYSWNSGPTSTAVVVTPSTSTNYSVIGTTNGCSQTATLSVSVYSAIPLSLSASQTLACVGTVVNFTANGAPNYTWNAAAASGNTNTIQLPVTTNTIISMSASDGVCTVTAALSVSVIPVPIVTISAQPSGTLCPGKTATLTAGGAVSYSWTSTSNISNVYTPIVTTSNVYTVTGANQACSRTQTVSVPVFPPVQLTVSASTSSICVGSSATLISMGADTYTWSSGTTGSTTVFSPNTSTVITVTGSSNNCTSSLNFQLQVFNLPGSVISSTPTLCKGSCNGAFSLTATAGFGPFTYSVSNSCGTTSCANMCAGVYTLTTADIHGCESAKVFTITEPSALTATSSANNPSCGNCGDGSISLNASGGTPGYTYTWSPSGGNGPVATSLFNGCYSIIITDSKACQTQTTVCISTTTGLKEEQQSAAWSVYPNPSKGSVYIESKAGVQVRIFNALGQMIRNFTTEQTLSSVSLQDCATGVYVIQVKEGSTETYKKIIID